MKIFKLRNDSIIFPYYEYGCYYSNTFTEKDKNNEFFKYRINNKEKVMGLLFSALKFKII